MKEISVIRLGKIETAHGRLEQAVARLEHAVVVQEESVQSALSAASMVEQDLQAKLQTIKTSHTRLETTARSVADRLDGTIEHLKVLLGE